MKYKEYREIWGRSLKPSRPHTDGVGCKKTDMLDNITSLCWICKNIRHKNPMALLVSTFFADGEIRLSTNFIKRWIFEAAWTLECHTPGYTAFVVLAEMGEELA